MKLSRIVRTFIALCLGSQCGCMAQRLHSGEDWSEADAVGMLYGEARVKLIHKGWTPRPTAVQGPDGPEREWKTAGSFLALGYIEVQQCSDMGIEPCAFNFRRGNGECLRVGTEGGLLNARVAGIDRLCYEE